MQSRSYEKKVILSHLGGIEFWAHVSTRRLHDVIRKKKPMNCGAWPLVMDFFGGEDCLADMYCQRFVNVPFDFECQHGFAAVKFPCSAFQLVSVNAD